MFFNTDFFEKIVAVIIGLGLFEGIKIIFISYFEDIVDARRWKINERREIRAKLLSVLSKAESITWKTPPTPDETKLLIEASNIVYKKNSFKTLLYISTNNSDYLPFSDMDTKLQKYLDIWSDYANKVRRMNNEDDKKNNTLTLLFDNLLPLHSELLNKIKSLV